jgi:hypothetical protein
MTEGNETIEAIWQRMDDNERFGVQFGLFPAWVEEYSLSREDHVALMLKAA